MTVPSDHAEPLIPRDDDGLAAQLEEILRRVDQLPILDSRTAEETIGYDEYGLPSSD